MTVFDDICRMAADNADLADFVVVYIEEAHPTDGWALSNNILISQHQTLEDRLTAAAQLPLSSLPDNMTVVTDSMSNELNHAYAGSPDRFYIIHSGMVAFQGEPGPFKFRSEPVASWLQTYRSTFHSDQL